jgi:choline dehydrogenase
LQHWPNLTVLTKASVTRLTFAGRGATGAEIFYQRRTQINAARLEVVLSLVRFRLRKY